MMDYRINWDDGAAAIPQKAADAALMADEVTLKLLFFILRSKRIPTAEELSASREAVEDALNFWVGLGVLEKKEPVPVQAAPKKEAIPDFKTIPPAQIAEALTASMELRQLFFEIENIKGKPLNHTEQQTFVWIYEYLCLDPEAIVLLYSFAVSQGKSSMSYLSKTAGDWCDRNIVTGAAAEEEILELQRTAAKVDALKNILSAKGLKGNFSDKAAKWHKKGITPELAGYACDYCARNNKLTADQVDKVLSGLSKNGISTAAEALARENSGSQRSSGSQRDSERRQMNYDGNRIYSSEELERRALENSLAAFRQQKNEV